MVDNDETTKWTHHIYIYIYIYIYSDHDMYVLAAWFDEPPVDDDRWLETFRFIHWPCQWHEGHKRTIEAVCLLGIVLYERDAQWHVIVLSVTTVVKAPSVHMTSSHPAILITQWRCELHTVENQRVCLQDRLLGQNHVFVRHTHIYICVCVCVWNAVENAKLYCGLCGDEWCIILFRSNRIFIHAFSGYCQLFIRLSQLSIAVSRWTQLIDPVNC